MLDLLADLAEETGVESVWVCEHPVLADPREPPSPMDPGDPILDPVTTLAFLAGRTRRSGAVPMSHQAAADLGTTVNGMWASPEGRSAEAVATCTPAASVYCSLFR
jgi:hypothetical protein